MKGLHVESVGSGSDLVMLHGWAMHGGIWNGVREQLAQTYRLHLVDLPGHGLSPADEAETFETMVEKVADFLPQNSIVCGWSLGGQIAIELALHESQRVQKLVLVSSTPCFAKRDDWQWGMDARQLQLFTENLKQNYKVTINRFLTLQMSGDQEVIEVLSQLRKYFFQRKQPDPGALQRGLEILQANDIRDKLSVVQQPVLLLHGENDVITHPAAARWMDQQLIRSKLILFPHCGHAPFLSSPEKFVSHMNEF